MTDTDKLKKVLDDRGIKLSKIAEVLGLSKPTIWSRLHGKSEFTVREANMLKDFLRLTTEEATEIFFS